MLPKELGKNLIEDNIEKDATLEIVVERNEYKVAKICSCGEELDGSIVTIQDFPIRLTFKYPINCTHKIKE